jgi:hypothetical protein
MKDTNTRHESDNAPQPVRVPLGNIYTTPGAQDAFADAGEAPLRYLIRHGRCDWGEVCAADAAENDLSLREGFRILSAYRLTTGVSIWIITEADRSATTILLPEEY